VLCEALRQAEKECRKEFMVMMVQKQKEILKKHGVEMD
jgi:hypothetical protein